METRSGKFQRRPCLTVHAFVSMFAQVAATVIAQATGAVDAGGIGSTSLCEEYTGHSTSSKTYILNTC